MTVLSGIGIAISVVMGLAIICALVASFFNRRINTEMEAQRLESIKAISQRVADALSDVCERENCDLATTTQRTGGAAVGAALVMDSMGLLRRGDEEAHRVMLAITRAVRHKDANPEHMLPVTIEALVKRPCCRCGEILGKEKGMVLHLCGHVTCLACVELHRCEWYGQKEEA
jgi:hypothetical protein